MTDDSALLAAIRAAPADDAPRLVYADWLDEHGQPERAEFIRVQCELARRDDPALRRREAQLLAEYHDALAGPLAAPHLRFRFERGFITGFGHSGVFASTLRRDGAAIFCNLLRFQPDRSVLIASTHLLGTLNWLQRLAVEIFQESERVGWGNYWMNPFKRPASIHADFLSLWEHSRYRGELDGLTMMFDIQDPNTEVWSQKQYVHYHIPGFHSFPET